MRSLQIKFERIGSSFSAHSTVPTPTQSAYRYSVEDSRQLPKIIPRSKPAIICGDLNFPKTSWTTNSSSSVEQNSVLELFEKAPLIPVFDFPTCSQNTPDMAF